MIIGHGGNKQALADELGCPAQDIVDMSSNLNPLGPPAFVEKVILENISAIKSLPEPDALSMRKGFARFHGIRTESVIAGNGTTWFIYTLPLAVNAKKALIAGPTYSDYQDACSMHGVSFDYCHATFDNGFIPNIDEISDKASDSDLVFICNPNNPTGVLLEREKLEYLIKKHPRTLFVIDESYLPFVETAEKISLVAETQYNNLIVLSSMSKIFRIPGLRTGFLSAPEAITQKVMAHYQPWSVNALAQDVIAYIFDHPQTIEPFYRETRDYIIREKEFFVDQLKDIDALTLIDASTYFILARLNDGTDSATFCSQIGRAKLLIRDCSNFNGLSNQYIRFSLKQKKENQMLIDQIKRAVNHG